MTSAPEIITLPKTRTLYVALVLLVVFPAIGLLAFSPPLVGCGVGNLRCRDMRSSLAFSWAPLKCRGAERLATQPRESSPSRRVASLRTQASVRGMSRECITGLATSAATSLPPLKAGKRP